MKKNFKYALLGAIALTGAMGFTACSTDSDVAEEKMNPTYDAETNTVKTQFVLNVNPAEQGTTRQAAATVQKANNFRGMKDAKLIGLSTGKANTFLAPFLGSSTGLTVNHTYDLGTLYSSGSVDNTDADETTSANKNNSSHRVVELTLPLKTDAMLVYGRAIPITKSSGTTTVTDQEENGSVVYSVAATPENTTFTLVSRMADAAAYTQCCNLAAAILNHIMLSGVDAHTKIKPNTDPAEDQTITRTTYDTSTDPATTIGSYTQEADLPALTWREIGIKTDAEIAVLAPLQENLAKAYSVIRKTYNNSDAVNSGSAASICSMMKDVYAIVSSVSKAVATNDAELNAQRLADEIKSRIEGYFDRENAAFPFRQVGSSTTGNSILKALYDAGVNVSGFTAVNDNNFPTFPNSFNVPEGVAQLEFTDYSSTTPITGGFAYKTTDNSASLVNLATLLNPTKYMYPSELLYFDNSLLRVTDADKDPNDYPDGYNKWDTDNWTGWTTGPVTSGTRSVAVKNNINYGVAMLQTTVVIDNTVTTGFKDNHPADEQVTLSAAQVGNFVLTGVLIGGQYKQVGWDYLTNSVADGNTNYVIYDTKMASNGATVASSTATPNYTLVFDNYTTETKQNDVYVALEFKNGNDVDIYGKGGIIPKGATFYLAAKLTLGSNTIASWPTTYAIPPYTDAGASQQVTRIFTQDYVTTATFKIGEESLKNAYTTVPDLRASQTSLGLSVDLQWRQGLSFETVLGQ